MRGKETRLGKATLLKNVLFPLTLSLSVGERETTAAQPYASEYPELFGF